MQKAHKKEVQPFLKLLAGYQSFETLASSYSLTTAEVFATHHLEFSQDQEHYQSLQELLVIDIDPLDVV